MRSKWFGVATRVMATWLPNLLFGKLSVQRHAGHPLGRHAAEGPASCAEPFVLRSSIDCNDKIHYSIPPVQSYLPLPKSASFHSVAEAANFHVQLRQFDPAIQMYQSALARMPKARGGEQAYKAANHSPRAVITELVMQDFVRFRKPE